MASTIRRIVVSAAVVAAAALLAACGGPSTGEHTGHTSSATAEPSEVAAHDPDDVAFAQNMIPHHQQAVDMSTMVPANTANPDVIALANQVLAAQLPEIQAFKAWLLQWGEDPNNPGHGGHGATGATGMLDQATMDKLRALRGADFDKLWLQSMITHHQGAIAMAQQEIAHGQNRDVISMAHSIVSTQQAEIDKMRQLLGD